MLGLPPYGALAVVSGTGADEFVGSLPSTIASGGDGVGRTSFVLPTGRPLGEGLNRTDRPAGSRLRIEVDPARI